MTPCGTSYVEVSEERGTVCETTWEAEEQGNRKDWVRLKSGCKVENCQWCLNCNGDTVDLRSTRKKHEFGLATGERERETVIELEGRIWWSSMVMEDISAMCSVESNINK